MSTDDTSATAAAGPALSEGLGPNAPKLTSEQVCNIGFAVLRAHNDDRLWRALTYDSGPYDLTTPNLALQELGAAFYAAGYASGGAQAVDKANSYIVDNARLAEEVDRLRESLVREEAQYPDMQRDAERYRWLRLQDWDTSPLAVVANPRAAIKLGHDAPSRDRLDAMIDAHVAEVQGFLNHTLDGLALRPNARLSGAGTASA